VPLQQINLKIPPAVLDHWRAQAAAQGLSVRDWLVSITAPTAEAPAGPAGAAGLADRVAALEAATAELREALGRLQPRPPRSPRPAPAAAPPAPALPPAAPPAGSLETAAVARLLGIRPKTLAEQVRKAGGPVAGLELYGWRCLGSRVSSRGGHPRAVWVPAGTPEVEGLAPDGSGDRVPPEGA
jgi:hypothetical protein